MVTQCTKGETYSTYVNTVWNNYLHYRNQCIELCLSFRVAALSSGSSYGLFYIPSGYQPRYQIENMYVTLSSHQYFSVTITPNNVIIINPKSNIPANDVLLIHEVWIQK